MKNNINKKMKIEMNKYKIKMIKKNNKKKMKKDNDK
jgi:hypothetical protein